jgi:hypothetical protein
MTRCQWSLTLKNPFSSNGKPRSTTDTTVPSVDWELYAKLKTDKSYLIQRNPTEVQAVFAQISPSEVNVNGCFYSEEQIRDAVSAWLMF